MNKVPKTQLPQGGTEWDKLLVATISRQFARISEAIDQGADGYLHQTTSVSTSHAASLNDSVVLVNATSGNKTVSLPAAAQCKDKRYVVKKIDSSGNLVIVDPNGTELIDNVTAYTISATYGSIDAVSDGSNWWVI